MKNEEDILRTIKDKNGIIIRWPVKKIEKKAVLDYLITKFDKNKQYKEIEINFILKKWHSFNDHALLRRELYDNFYLNRTNDGSSYWVNNES